MGGALAEMLAVHLTASCSSHTLASCVEELGAITFESPSFPLQAFKHAVQIDGYHNAKAILQLKSAPNIINTLFPPVGAEIRRVAVPHCEDVGSSSTDALTDIGNLLLDCAFLFPTIKDPIRLLQGGATAAAARAITASVQGESAWFQQQHNIERLHQHLASQYRVRSWPRWSDVCWPRPHAGHIALDGVLPVLGPAARLASRLHGITGQAGCREAARRRIEAHVLSMPGFLQDHEPVQRQLWGVGVGDEPFNMLGN